MLSTNGARGSLRRPFCSPPNQAKNAPKSRQGASGISENYPASVTLFTHAYMVSSKNPAGWGSRAGGSYVGGLAAMGILVSGGYQLLKLWIISKFFLLGYTRSGDQVSERGPRRGC
jgi:hypothetical protein